LIFSPPAKKLRTAIWGIGGIWNGIRFGNISFRFSVSCAFPICGAVGTFPCCRTHSGWPLAKCLFYKPSISKLSKLSMYNRQSTNSQHSLAFGKFRVSRAKAHNPPLNVRGNRRVGVGGELKAIGLIKQRPILLLGQTKLAATPLMSPLS
jgi:hypothetical protein